MLKLADQLKKFPEQFTLIVEEIKDKKFESALTYIMQEYDLIESFNDLDEKSKEDFFIFLKRIYIFGFYSGLSFGLNPYEYARDIYDIEDEDNEKRDLS